MSPAECFVRYRESHITYDAQGNLLTLRRYAPTASNPTGTTVDQLTYTYTARTNRLASVADAVSTDLDWDAKPSTFQYNRMGSMTQMAETLSSTSFREIEVQHYDCLSRSSGERQLPEELQIRLFVAPGGMVEATQVSYHYDVNGQRIGKHVRPA